MYSHPLGNICCESFGDVRFDFGPHLQVKLGRVSIKMHISRLLLVRKVCNVQSTFRKLLAANLLVVSDMTL